MKKVALFMLSFLTLFPTFRLSSLEYQATHQAEEKNVKNCQLPLLKVIAGTAGLVVCFSMLSGAAAKAWPLNQLFLESFNNFLTTHSFKCDQFRIEKWQGDCFLVHDPHFNPTLTRQFDSVRAESALSPFQSLFTIALALGSGYLLFDGMNDMSNLQHTTQEPSLF